MPRELDDKEIDGLLDDDGAPETDPQFPEPEGEEGEEGVDRPLLETSPEDEKPTREEPEEEGEDPELYADEEGDDLSTKMRKRIYRERRRNFEEQALIEDRLYETVVENLSLRAEAYEAKAKNIDGEMGDIRRQLKAAKEEGNTDKETELTEKLATLRYRQERLKDEADGAKGRFEQAKKDRVPAMARAWVKMNKWFNSDDPRYTEARAYAREVDLELARSGKDQNTPEYYREIDRRVQQKYGKVFGMKRTQPTSSGSEERQERRPASPTGGIRPSPSGGNGNGSRSSLSKSEQDRMQQFGLDPKDPKQVARWVREAREINKSTRSGR